MPWFKVDDNLAFHAKAVAAGNPAMGLWVRAGAWCAQQLTDGLVPFHMLNALGTTQQAKRLVDQKLWILEQDGYRFHGWVERQPSKGEVEAERAAARERMKAYRAKKKAAASQPKPQVSEPRSPEQTENFSGSSAEVREVFGNPDPTRPNPSPDPSITTRPRKRGTQLPDDFKPNDKHLALAAEKGINLRDEWPQFCDHHRSRGSVMKDWDAALNTWIRRAVQYGRAEPATNVHRLPSVHELEEPPDGLSDEEYAEWYAAQVRKRGSR